jgi:diguanylate cyclase (GGDEF)-like protein
MNWYFCPVLEYNDGYYAKIGRILQDGWTINSLSNNKKTLIDVGGESDMIKKHLFQSALVATPKESTAWCVCERKLQALLGANRDLIVCVRDDGTYCEIIEPQGWAPFDLTKLKHSKTIFDHLPPVLASRFLTGIQQAIRTDQRQIFEYNIFFDHVERSRECYIVMLDEHKTLVIIRDITERGNLECLLQQLVEACSTASGVAIFQSLMQHLANYLNVALAVMGEYDATTKLFKILAGVSVLREIKLSAFSLDGTVFEVVIQGEELFIKDNAAALYPLDNLLQQISAISIIAIPLRDSTDQVIGAILLAADKPLANMGLIGNVMRLFAIQAAAELERLQTKQSIENMAVTDELTHMPNRGYLRQEMGRLLTLSENNVVTAAFLFINLDRFSLINDALGHVKGDWLMKLFANRLLQVMSERQGFACRFGGDEFVIVLANLHSVAEVDCFASEVLELLHEPVLIEHEAYSVGASIGVSLFPQDGTDGQLLLQNADIAMNVAKQSGRNQCQFYHDALQKSAALKLGLENKLRQAVQNNHFVLHYQPQYSIESGQVVGMEALVRWQQAEQRLIPPAEFIPLAEETGLIIPLGNWVLWEACRQNKDWQMKGYSPVRVAVNISPAQFRAANFIEIVSNTLLVTGLEAQWLEIEFTEGLTMEKSGVVLANMQALFAMGVHMSIDDFGTGYSSLNYLKYFPIQTLKIDRSFVAGMTVDQSDSAIISAIIAMGNSLNLSLVAEGIETEGQLQLLKEQKCHTAQGFLFSKPLSAQDFEERILTGT